MNGQRYNRQGGCGWEADYLPFAYYNENFALDGFDVALIRAIGARLGVDVEIKDFAFAG